MVAPGDVADLDPQRRKAGCVPLVLNVLADFRESSAFSVGEGGAGCPFSRFVQVFQTVMRKETYHRYPWQLERMAHPGRWLTLTDV